MSLQPATYEAAQAQFKPLKRTAMNRQGQGLKTSPANSSARRAPLRKKPKRKKRLTDGQLKKRVWKQFSIWIRLREADAEGYTVCVTCGERKFWKTEMQAGHFIRGRLNANLFDERGCRAQCLRCNIHLQGNVVLYYKFMLATYGQEVIDELLEQNNQTRKWLPGELAALLEKYRAINAANPLLQE
jgi:hypothetical protein